MSGRCLGSKQKLAITTKKFQHKEDIMEDSLPVVKSEIEEIDFDTSFNISQEIIYHNGVNTNSSIPIDIYKAFN